VSEIKSVKIPQNNANTFVLTITIRSYKKIIMSGPHRR